MGVNIIPEPPLPNALDFIEDCIQEGIKIHICSTRAMTPQGKEVIRNYLVEFLGEKMVDNNITISATKEPAILTIDDRAYCFQGEFPSIDFIKTFKP